MNLLASITCANLARQRIAIKSWQAQVERPDIRSKIKSDAKAAGAVICGLNFVTVVREQDSGRLTYVFIVLHASDMAFFRPCMRTTPKAMISAAQLVL
jgi:hypothetical protein